MSQRPDEPTPTPAELVSSAGTARALTRRELDVLTVMVERATPFDPDGADQGVGDADRMRWRAQLPTTRVGRACGCGSCPSIELTDAAGASPGVTTSRVVLSAETDEALLLLFIDDDRLSYLELAPSADHAVEEFPDPDDVRTA